LLAVGLLFAASAALAQEIPTNTVIPIMLTSTIDASKAHAGQVVVGKLMERIPLLSGSIPEGAKVFGHVAQVSKNQGAGSTVSVVFDKIVSKNREVVINTNVRAVASMMAVYDAQIPIFEPDRESRSTWRLIPVGGESAASEHGIWSNSARASYADTHCTGENRTAPWSGTLWVFSPFACGTYGFGRGLAIGHDGQTKPVGQIELRSNKNVQVHSGSGLLLMQNAVKRESAQLQ
jgi:hypothetical protein